MGKESSSTTSTRNSGTQVLAELRSDQCINLPMTVKSSLEAGAFINDVRHSHTMAEPVVLEVEGSGASDGSEGSRFVVNCGFYALMAVVSLVLKRSQEVVTGKRQEIVSIGSQENAIFLLNQSFCLIVVLQVKSH